MTSNRDSVGIQRIVNKGILFDQIVFISDIERFTPEIGTKLLKEITDKKIRLLVLTGDINSFLEEGLAYFAIYENAHAAVSLFYEAKELEKLRKKMPIGALDVEKFIIGQKVSQVLEQENKTSLDAFFLFVDNCRTLAVEIIYYSGNHDSMLSYQRLVFEAQYIPLLQRFVEQPNLHIIPDLQVVTLNPELSIVGIHTNTGTSRCNDFSWLKQHTKTLEQTIPEPEKTIFVSHLPGTSKFKNLGSEDILLFKRRYKFKLHIHGHCKDYHGEYAEEGVPTQSVHMKEEKKE